ncbi:MAG: c-type cytochrome [Bacteroidetes bacterium]|nr:c-type cytochrome [Bacteroidota bacterium]
MRPSIYHKSILALATVAVSCISYAQEAAPAAAAPAPATSGGGQSYFAYVLIIFATLLLFAVAALGQMLIRLTEYAYRNKGTIVKSVVLIMMMAATAHTAIAQDATPAATAAAPAATASTPSIFGMDVTAAIAIILLEALVIAVMLIRIWALLNTINPQAAKPAIHFELPKFLDRFNASVAVEHEQDVMLDHDYDGIKELDNSLPPWWKYGFIFTIIWAFGYIGYYHVAEAAPLSAGEYANEMEAAKKAKDEYMRTAKNNVDENTIKFDQAYVAEGAKIFADNCKACHGEKGEGGVGPNLTDQFWLHGGKINDVFKTVKYGWPANGMKSWQSDLSSVQIAQVVCYVKSLKGTNPPNPKAPQGTIYSEGDSTQTAAAPAAPVDSTAKSN